MAAVISILIGDSSAPLVIPLPRSHIHAHAHAYTCIYAHIGAGRRAGRRAGAHSRSQALAGTLTLALGRRRPFKPTFLYRPQFFFPHSLLSSTSDLFLLGPFGPIPFIKKNLYFLSLLFILTWYLAKLYHSIPIHSSLSLV